MNIVKFARNLRVPKGFISAEGVRHTILKTIRVLKRAFQGLFTFYKENRKVILVVVGVTFSFIVIIVGYRWARMDYLRKNYRSPLNDPVSFESYITSVKSYSDEGEMQREVVEIGDSHEVVLSSRVRGSDTVKVSRGNEGVSFAPVDSRTLGRVNDIGLTLSSDRTEFSYEDIYNGVNLIYTVSPTLVLEEYEVGAKLDLQEFVQRVNLAGVTYEGAGDGSYLFKSIETGEIIFSLPRPVMYEKHDTGSRSYGLSYEFKEVDGNLFLIKRIDETGRAWLEQASYPVMIDGTIFTDSLTLESYPISLGKWQVRIDTVGVADLSFSATSGAVFESFTCGSNAVEVNEVDDTYSVVGFSCKNEAIVTYEISLEEAASYTLSVGFGAETAEVTTSYDPAQDSPVFVSINQTPTYVKPGDLMVVSAHITDSSGVTTVKADLGESLPTIDLQLVEGSATDGTWRGEWVAEGTGPIWYQTFITATNTKGLSSTSDPIDWSDWSDLGGGDHGGSDWTISVGTSVAGVHTNVGTFTINPGVTVTVQAYNGSDYGSFSVEATAADIQGTIFADGKGYRGGARLTAGEGTGGGGAGQSSCCSNGGGGGGHGGEGGDSGGIQGGSIYGSFTDPVTMGSGGGGADVGGGNGGGMVSIKTTGALNVDGTITANGLTGSSALMPGGGGSGGTVYLEAVDLSGSGTVRTNGGNGRAGGWATSGNGAGGRVVVYFTGTNTYDGTLTANVGTGGGGGEAGIAFIEDTTNNDIIVPCANGPWRTGDRTFSFRNFTLEGNIIFEPVNASTFTLTSSGTTTIADGITIAVRGSYTNDTDGVGIFLNLTGDVSIPSGTIINANGKGYAGGAVRVQGYGSGGGGGGSSSCCTSAGGGGGYGGAGGSSGSTQGGTTYGSPSAPTDLGSGGGGGGGGGGYGGGAIRIETTGTLDIGGSITTNGLIGGNDYMPGGGGSGGSIYIVADSISGNGILMANGGNGRAGSWGTSGNGGGGRISLVYTNSYTLSNTPLVSAGTGGSGGETGTANISRVSTWDGEGTDETCGGEAGDGNKWSCSANWVGDTVPSSTGIARFDGTSTKDATIDGDFEGAIGSLDIFQNYTGTITQGRALVINNDLTISDGTFDGDEWELTVNGDFIQIGGTFIQGTNDTNSLLVGLVGYWPMDDNAGSTTVLDSLGAHNGVARRNTSLLTTSGYIDNALIFNGSSDYISIATTLPTTDFTYSVWVNHGATNDETILMAADGSGKDELNLYMNSSNLLVKLDNAVVKQEAKNFSAGSWVHFVLTRSGSVVNLYVNGILFDSGTSSAVLGFSTCSLLVGVDADGTCQGSLGNYLQGKIDELRVYDRALTSYEISNLAAGETLSQGNSLTINGSFTQSGGTFTSSDGQSMSIADSFTQSEGEFTGGESGRLAIGGNFELIDGTFTNGTSTIIFDGTSSSNLSCNNVSLNAVEIKKSSNTSAVVIDNTCSLPLSDGEVTGVLNVDGTLSGTGLLTLNTGTTSANIFNDDAVLSGFSGLTTTGDIGVSGASMNLSAYTTFAANDVSITSGTLDFPASSSSSISGSYSQNGGTVTTGSGNVDIDESFTLSSGGFTAPSGVLYVGGSFVVSEGEFTHNSGTVTFDGGNCGDLSIDAVDVDLSLVTINRSSSSCYSSYTLTVSSGTTIPLGNSPTVTLYNGISSYGYNLTNNGTITIGTGSAVFNIEGTFTNNGIFEGDIGTSSWVMNGNFTNNGDVDLSSLSVFDFNNYSYGAGSLNNNSGSSFISGSAPSFSVAGSFVINTASTFPSPVSLLTLDGDYGGSTSLDVPGIDLSLVTVNRSAKCSSSCTLTISSGTTVPLGDSPTFTLYESNSGDRYHLTNNGTITLGTGTATFNVDGIFTNNGTFEGNSGTSSWTMNGEFANNGIVDLTSTSTFDFNTYYGGSGSLSNNAGASFVTNTSPSFSINGGFTINSGSTFPSNIELLALDGGYAGDTSVDASGITFTLVTINRSIYTTTSRILTIVDGTTISLGDSPTITLNNTYTGDMYGLTNNGTITMGTGDAVFNIDGDLTNNGTIDGSGLTSWELNGTLINSGTVDMSLVSSFDINTYNQGSGSLSNNAGASFVTNTSPSFSVSINGNLTVSSESTFPSVIALTLDGTADANDSTISAPGISLSSITINKTHASGNTTFTHDMTVSGDFTRVNGPVLNPASAITLVVGGDLSVSTSDNFGGANLAIVLNGSGDQGLGANSMASPITIDKTSGEMLLTSLFSGSAVVDVTNGALDFAGYNFDAGGLSICGACTLRLQGNEVVGDVPTLNQGSTVIYYGDGDSSADSLQLRSWAYSDLVINANDTGDAFSIPEYNYVAGLYGDYYDGTAFDTYVNSYVDGTINFNPADTVLGANRANGGDTFSVRWTGQVKADYSQTYTFYTYSDDGVRLWVNGVQLVNDWTTHRPTERSGTISLTAGEWYDITLEFFESGAGSVITLSYSAPSVPKIIIPSTNLRTCGHDDCTTNSDYLDISGDMEISSGVLESPSEIYVGGDLTLGADGVFTHNSGTVNLTGTNQTITGDFTFYNLTKETATTDTLTFTAEDRQTIEGDLTLKGSANNLLSLRSTVEGTQWEVDPQGARDISYIDVQDSNNVNDATIVIGYRMIYRDSGNNLNWFFQTIDNITKSIKSDGGIKFNGIRIDP